MSLHGDLVDEAVYMEIIVCLARNLWRFKINLLKNKIDFRQILIISKINKHFQTLMHSQKIIKIP
jgi:hypothetical protein